MGVKMAECEPPPVPDSSISDCSTLVSRKDPFEPPFLPYWARYESQCAQNLLDYSDEPIEYDHDDEDYRDNCFFFPEDCSYTPPKDWLETHYISVDTPEIRVEEYTSADQDSNRNTTTDIDIDTDTMIPGLPDIKMIDSEALSDLLEDNLSPPEITTIMYDPHPLIPHTPTPKKQKQQLTQPSQRLRNKRRSLRLRLNPILPPTPKPKRNLRRRLHMLRQNRLNRQPDRREPSQPPILLRNSKVNVPR